MTHFFNKFPTLTYANTTAVNLLARVNMDKISLQNKSVFYEYAVPDGTRPDNLSYNYYDNSDYVWLINLANQIIDPYYDFPLSYDDLNSLIIQQYGSISTAQQTILFFRTNYSSDDSIISPGAWNNLSVGEKKYWEPQINQQNLPVAYIRKPEAWIQSTNQIIQLGISYSNQLLTQDGYDLTTQDGYDITLPEGSSGTTFQVGELVTQNNVPIATVSAANSSALVVQHIAGTFTIDTVVGGTTQASAFVSSSTTIQTNIPSAESKYWSPVSAFDYMHEQNARKRNLKLLDNKYAAQATKELKNLLQ
jgi:hypothetical protein